MVTLKRKEVLDLLSNKVMSMNELIKELQDRHPGLNDSQAKAVILPLLSSRAIEFTKDRKLTTAVVPA